MMKQILGAVLTFFLSLGLSACVTKAPPINFYVLHPSEKQYSPVSGGVVLGVGPVDLADYLDRPELVVRISDHEVRLAELDQWAGSLKENITSVMAENFSSLLMTDRIKIYPWRPGLPIEYQLTVNIIRLDGAPGDKVSLKAVWTLYGEDGKGELVSKTSSFTHPVKGESLIALVAAQSEAIGKLCQEVALEITNRRKQS